MGLIELLDFIHFILAAPSAVACFYAYVRYFKNQHKFHRFGLLLIGAGFSIEFLAGIGVFSDMSPLTILVELGVHVLIIHLVCVLIRKWWLGHKRKQLG